MTLVRTLFQLEFYITRLFAEAEQMRLVERDDG